MITVGDFRRTLVGARASERELATLDMSFEKFLEVGRKLNEPIRASEREEPPPV